MVKCGSSLLQITRVIPKVSGLDILDSNIFHFVIYDVIDL